MKSVPAALQPFSIMIPYTMCMWNPALLYSVCVCNSAILDAIINNICTWIVSCVPWQSYKNTVGKFAKSIAKVCIREQRGGLQDKCKTCAKRWKGATTVDMERKLDMDKWSNNISHRFRLTSPCFAHMYNLKQICAMCIWAKSSGLIFKVHHLCFMFKKDSSWHQIAIKYL